MHRLVPTPDFVSAELMGGIATAIRIRQHTLKRKWLLAFAQMATLIGDRQRLQAGVGLRNVEIARPPIKDDPADHKS